MTQLLRTAQCLVRAVRSYLRCTPLPLGRVSDDRRLLRSERDRLGDHILVIGNPVAVRQAVPELRLDILGVEPFDRAVTVLSDGLGAGALPVRRWSSVIIIDPPPAEATLLFEAATSACRPGGAIVLLGQRHSGRAGGLDAIAGARVPAHHGYRGGRQLMRWGLP